MSKLSLSTAFIAASLTLFGCQDRRTIEEFDIDAEDSVTDGFTDILDPSPCTGKPGIPDFSEAREAAFDEETEYTQAELLQIVEGFHAKVLEFLACNNWNVLVREDHSEIVNEYGYTNYQSNTYSSTDFEGEIFCMYEVDVNDITEDPPVAYDVYGCRFSSPELMIWAWAVKDQVPQVSLGVTLPETDEVFEATVTDTWFYLSGHSLNSGLSEGITRDYYCDENLGCTKDLFESINNFTRVIKAVIAQDDK